MCYGDINHGRDGYYQDWAEREEERQMMTLMEDPEDV